MVAAVAAVASSFHFLQDLLEAFVPLNHWSSSVAAAAAVVERDLAPIFVAA